MHEAVNSYKKNIKQGKSFSVFEIPMNIKSFKEAKRKLFFSDLPILLTSPRFNGLYYHETISLLKIL